ncbi:unnamed protein product [Agarophyton chilense]
MDLNALDEDVKDVMSGIVDLVATHMKAMEKEEVAKNIKGTLQSIHINRDSLPICLPAIMKLSALISSPSNTEALTSQGFIKDLCYTCQKFSDDQTFVAQAGYLIASLIFENEGSREVFETNFGLGILTDFITKHLRSTTVQKPVLMAVRNVAWNSKTNCEQIRRSNTLPVLFLLMTLHSNQKDVMNEILACIYQFIAFDGYWRGKILSNSSYLDQLMFEWKFNIKNYDLAKWFVLILVQLTNDGAHPDRIGIKVVSQAGTGLAGTTISGLLMDAVFVQDDAMVVSLSKLIYSLGFMENFRENVSHTYALHHLIKALGFCVQSPGSLMSVLRAIECLLSGADIAKVKFNDVKGMNGMLIMIKVMELYKDDELITEICCRILDNAADGQLCTTNILVDDKEILGKAILTAMAKYPKNALIQERSCLLLIKIASSHPSAAECLHKQGARGLVHEARRTYSSDPSVSSLVSHLLTLLREKGPTRDRSRTADGPKLASVRLRSRSRTVEEPNETRARAERNRSPGNMLMRGRRVLDAANDNYHVDGLESSASSDVVGVKLLVGSKRSERRNSKLETVFERNRSLGRNSQPTKDQQVNQNHSKT